MSLPSNRAASGAAALRALVLLAALLSPSAQTPSQLPADQLSERVRGAATEVLRLQAATKANVEALDVIADDLAAGLERLRAPLPPRPPSLDDVGVEDREAVEANLEVAEQFLSSWRDRMSVRQRVESMLAEADELGAGLTDDVERLYERFTQTRGLFIEAQRRSIRGELDEAALELPPGAALEELVRRSADAMDRRDEGLASIQQLLARLEGYRLAFEALPAVDPELVRIAGRTAQALSTIGEAVAVQGELLARLEALPAEALPTEIERLTREWSTRRAALEQAAAAVEERAAELDEVVAARAAVRPPTREDVPEGEGLPEVREARREVELARRLIAWFEQDAAAADAVDAARVQLLAADDLAEKLHGEFSTQTARVVRALRLALEEREAGALPDWSPVPGATLTEVWDVWRSLQHAQVLRTERAEAVRAALQDESGKERDLARLEAERESLVRAEAKLQTELSYAEFVETMAARSDEDLVGFLTDDGPTAAELDRVAGELTVLDAQRAEARARCDARTIEMRGIESPYTRAALRSRSPALDRIRGDLAALPEGEVPSDTSGSLLPSPGDFPAREGAEVLVSTRKPIELARKEADRIAQQQVFARSLLRYHEELLQVLESWRTELDELGKLGERRVELLRARVRALKLRYAATLEAARRVEAGRLERDRVPRQRTAPAGQVALDEANERLRQALREQTELDRRAKAEVARLEVLVALTPAMRERAAAADERARLIGSPLSNLEAASTPLDELDEVERRDLQYRAEVAQARTATVFSWIARRFSTPRVVERFEVPLAAYHLELENIRRVRRELEQARAAYGAIVEVWEAEKAEFEPALEQVQGVLQQRVRDYHVARYAAAVARHPGSRQRLEEAFRATFGRPLTYRLSFSEGDVEAAADDLFAAEIRLVATRALADDVDVLLSRLGADQEIGWYREQAGRIASRMEVEKAREEALQEQTDDLRERFFLRLRNDSLRSLGFALLIPLIAFLVVRAVRRFARRFETDISGELGEQDADRRRRVRTIARTSTAAVSVLLWLLAMVYVFAQLGLDITPIIASASVVGLAVAFGAQALIKDFFYGFFILIENQFTVGDIVSLGPVTGTVESISLRITTLRDLEGTVHYIPNGSIGQVSNKTQGWSRVVMEFSFPHDHDPDEAQEVLRAVLEEMAADPVWAQRVLDEPVVAGVERLTENSVDIRVMIKCRPGRQWEVAREARRRVKLRFRQLGIRVPFPHRVVHNVSDGEAPAPPAPPAAGDRT